MGASFTESVQEELRVQHKLLTDRLDKSDDRVATLLRKTIEKAETKAAQERERLNAKLRDLSHLQVEIRLAMKRLHPSEARGRQRARTAPKRPRDLVDTSGDVLSVPRDSILELSACAVCGCPDFTPVCEYNKFLVIDSHLVDGAASYYDYSMCHGCGVVFARCRPVGARYRYLLQRFEVAIGRSQDGSPLSSVKAAFSSGSLTDADRRALHERVSKGVFVSEHLGLPKRDHLRDLLRDRLANSVHIEVLGSLLSLDRPRVLELRPRVGSIGAGLQRLYGADVYAMPLFDGQQFLVQETYRIPAEHKLEYDRFSIPYEGQFDLIVANHMVTHVLRPQDFFATLRGRLGPGGHVYFYNEPDESDFLDEEKSIINRLNAFHVQVFNGPSLTRALQASGFEPVFVAHHDRHLLALARSSVADVLPARMPAGERQRRIQAYQAARDLAILKLPAQLQVRFATEQEDVVRRAFDVGSTDRDVAARG
jgi:SAM-dependent methyltransferase